MSTVGLFEELCQPSRRASRRRRASGPGSRRLRRRLRGLRVTRPGRVPLGPGPSRYLPALRADLRVDPDQGVHPAVHRGLRTAAGSRAPPTFAQFAQAVVRLAEDEALLRRAVDAVSCGDAEAWQAVLAKLKLQPFCYLLCRWVCSSFYRRFCHLVCFPRVAVLVDPVSELRAAAKVMAEVLKNQKAFEAIGKVAETLHCERTKAAIGKAGFGRHCEIICWVFCTWRCGWVCRELCLRPIPVLTGVHAIEEARAFALAARPLVSHPRVLFDLVTAVQGRDAQRYGAIVDRFDFHPYCLQLCSWVCSSRLHRILHLHLPRSGAAPLVHDGGVLRHLRGHRPAVGQDQQVPAVPEPGEVGAARTSRSTARCSLAASVPDEFPDVRAWR